MQNAITIAQLIELINRYDKKNQTQHGRYVLEYIFRELCPEIVDPVLIRSRGPLA